MWTCVYGSNYPGWGRAGIFCFHCFCLHSSVIKYTHCRRAHPWQAQGGSWCPHTYTPCTRALLTGHARVHALQKGAITRLAKRHTVPGAGEAGVLTRTRLATGQSKQGTYFTSSKTEQPWRVHLTSGSNGSWWHWSSATAHDNWPGWISSALTTTRNPVGQYQT